MYGLLTSQNTLIYYVEHVMYAFYDSTHFIGLLIIIKARPFTNRYKYIESRA